MSDAGAAHVDWPGYPARIGACLGRDRALELLDWTVAGAGDLGRLRHQEEYVEWRVVREGDRIRRIEMTTELSADWEILAAQEPARTLELVSSFAGEEVSWPAVYAENPSDPGSTTATRRAAFRPADALPRRRRSVPRGGGGREPVQHRRAGAVLHAAPEQHAGPPCSSWASTRWHRSSSSTIRSPDGCGTHRAQR